jgi:polyisoprenoid-binding protein YceI
MVRFLLIALLMAGPALAAPRAYVLQADQSTVEFETDFGPDRITGAMPVRSADLTLDFDDVAKCRVDVSLDVSNAEASFPFAAQAMKGPKVLDAGAYPEIVFHSTSVRAKGDGALVDGQVTIRGVTRPAVLDAMIWRQKGTQPGDLSHLTIRLTGSLRRSDFGATGWADMVGDEVRIVILARIERVD